MANVSLPKINSVQVLRAVAAFVVLVEHVFSEARARFGFEYNPFHFPFTIGVDLFFVISGFIMVYTNFDNFGNSKSWKIFFERRVIRVVPLYYIFTTLMVVALVVLPEQIGKTKFDLVQVLSSYFFFPYARYDGRISPVLSLGWTLNYEMFFYVIFACVMFLRINVALISLTVFMTILVLLGVLGVSSNPAFLFWSSPIILEFCAGAWIAWILVRRPPARSLVVGWIIIVLAIAWAWGCTLVEASGHPVPRVVQQGVPAAAILFAATILLRGTAAFPDWMLQLGDSSYALYLSHRFPLRILSTVWNRLPILNGRFPIVYVIVALATCLAVGHLVYLFVERPVLRRLMTLRAARSRIVAA